MAESRDLISQHASEREPIAIIGIGCRLPGGADSPEKFWELLAEGVDAISDVPSERYSIDAFYDPGPARQGKTTTRWGGFVKQRVEEFDAQFFGMSPREAACLDPLQRWLLEVTWEALEDGGLVPERVAGSNVGVFIGGFTLDNTIMQFSEGNRHLFEAHTATGTALTMLSARLSYFFDFKGPCFTLDTACSSSLVAVHLACQSIWNKESSLALAGGANAMFMPEHTIAESMAGMMSPDGRCKAFDASANGYVRGEGAAIVLLKPLSQALTDGDEIYAVIRGTACNQDGLTNGITVPNSSAQEEVIRNACSRAGIVPGQVQYVEAHGTGTPVGDPIEARALANALAEGRPAGQKCLVGSVKTNIGHTEAVAGVAGLIKAALALHQRQVPPNLHFKRPNPAIPFEDICLQVPTQLSAWPDPERPAIAGVNSFGFGGTNAHVILQEAPRNAVRGEPGGKAESAVFLPISAKSAGALRELVARYRALLASEDAPSLNDVCFSASLRRGHYSHGKLFACRSRQELLEQVDDFLAGENESPEPRSVKGTKKAQAKKGVAFVFTGMGPQWWGMGQSLLKQEPVFQKAVEEVDELFRQYAGWSLLEAMKADEESSRMAETEVAQPANFALQVGLAALFRSLGVEPDGIIGHSAGEVAAAYVAGMMSLDEAVKVIYHRSRLQQKTTGQGKLVAVGLPLEEAQQAIAAWSDRISIAAVNGPSSVTLVGDLETLQEVTGPLEEKGTFCRYLNVKVPYHSHFMKPIREELLEVLHDLALQPAVLPLYSTVTGKLTEGPEMDAEYWWKNVREPVYFAKAIRALIEDQYEVFLEIGPHPTLGASIRECLAEAGRDGVVVSSLKRFENEQELVFDALGELYAQGVPIDWERFFPQGGRLVRLPNYPWQREEHWKESEGSKRYRFAHKPHPLLGRSFPLPHPAWEVEIDRRKLSYLDDHRIQGAVVFPGAGFVEMAWAAAQEAYPNGATSMEIEFLKALFLKEGEQPSLHVSIDKRDASFEIHSRPKNPSEPWALHSRGKLGQEQRVDKPAKRERFLRARKSCRKEISQERCYQQFCKMGLEYGERFRGIGRLWQGDNEAVAQIEIPAQIDAEAGQYRIHPAVLDLCFQVLAAALSFSEEDEGDNAAVYMPTGVDRGTVCGRPQSKMWIHAAITSKDDKLLKGDIILCDDQGNILVEIEGCRAVTLENQTAGGLRRKAQDLYEVKWVSEPEQNEEDSSDRASRNSWIVFADSQGVGDELARQLELDGKKCLRVLPGACYQSVADGVCRLDPENPEHFGMLVAQEMSPGGSGWGVAYLWSLDVADPGRLDTATLAEAENLGPIGVMHLVQALASAPAEVNARLWIVTRGAQSLAGDLPETMAVGQGSLWGLGRVIGHQESRDIWGGMIDLDPSCRKEDVLLLKKKMEQAGTEDEFAFRNGSVALSRLAPCLKVAASLPQSFPPDKSYLVTGGLGSLGLLVARWLVKRGARHLILLGRSLPDSCDWDNPLPVGRHAEAVTVIRELEKIGAHCHLASVDVTKAEEMAAFLEGYRQSGHPPIYGLVHSAGTASPQLLVNMTAEEFRSVHRAKTFGAWHLHSQLSQEPLEFFILFSSVASLVVSPGQGNYAAGNAFLDGLAHYRRALGLPAMSINWGPWGEVGMATQFEDLNEYFDRRGMYPMPSEHGMEAFGRVFGQDTPQVMILSANWPLVNSMNYPGRGPQLISELASESDKNGDGASEEMPLDDGDSVLGALLAADPSERSDILAAYVQNVVARVLRLSKSQRKQLTFEQPLNSYGLDSMMAIEMKTLIDRQMGAEVAVMDLLNGLTALQLAEKLLEQMAESLEQAEWLLESA